MPWFDWFFTGSLSKSDVAFFSDRVIGNIDIPILILHAKDDHVVPFVLGVKLYEAAKASRKAESRPLFFVPFESHHGYAHVSIHLAPELPKIVKEFFNKSIENTWDDKNLQGELSWT